MCARTSTAGAVRAGGGERPKSICRGCEGVLKTPRVDGGGRGEDCEDGEVFFGDVWGGAGGGAV